ncbi:ribonuclease III [Roseitalea porphyridii]|uniref:Ribonuclease 3 n=1 Tax=Roseitalea porphyridii TaxID=1852022 RepID=A0A4P6V091_9HYPH|nr:ribonuclease III [Roseitalea porphyridii]QBK30233.1 ribonuclease III [Roseitalea porphyridii]
MTTGSAAEPPVSDATLAHLHRVTGHAFADLERLDRALTHSSARARTGTDYERLEFLGDRVLGLCVAELLFAEFRDADEGELSVRLNALVNSETLASVADELGLTPFIRTGADMGDIGSARLKSVRADVVEALIATIYLDGGLEAARAFITRCWTERARHVMAARRDAKTELQEWTHKTFSETPSYRVVGRDGPDHAPSFTVEVRIGKLRPEQATGPSKRQAEQLAATALLIREGIWPVDGLAS